MQNIIGKTVRQIDSEGYEILRSIQAYEYTKYLTSDHGAIVADLCQHQGQSTKSFNNAKTIMVPIKATPIIISTLSAFSDGLRRNTAS